MARPLRMDVSDGWYHVTARGIERRTIFRQAAEYEHFEKLLAEAVERFRLVIHAAVQLENHYHLIVQTPDANLSRAMQWVNVSYAVWFNRRNDRVGPLFQGRFKSVPVQDTAWAYELSLYVHLNPIMRKVHGLDKVGKKAEARGLAVPDREAVSRRLAALRRYRWSSYRAYAGYAKSPAWLETGEILCRASPQAQADVRVKRYRHDVRQRLTKGVDPEFKERLAEGFALGAEAFRDRVRRMAKGGREVSGTRELRQRIPFADVVRMVENLRGERSDAFMARRGDWGRSLLLWVARRYTGMTLKEIGTAAGGMDYTAVAMAIKRFEQKASRDASLRGKMQTLRRRCEM